MSDLPVIGYRAMRKELWDRWKEMYGEKLFPRPKQAIWRAINFLAVVLSQID